MDKKELNNLLEEAIKQITEWAMAEPNIIDREMLNAFALPIGVAHLKSNISAEELANVVILCLIAAYNLGAHTNQGQVIPSAVKLDD